MKAINEMTNNELLKASEQHRVGMGEGYNPYEVEYERRLDAKLKDAKAAFAAEWTKEITIERRKIWNETQKKLAPKTRLTKNQMMAFIKQIEAEVGFDMLTLKEAVKNHAL